MRLQSWRCCSWTHGTGMLMTTSFSSRLSSCNSYSMFTSQPEPLSEGQQFTVKHTQDMESGSESGIERQTTQKAQNALQSHSHTDGGTAPKHWRQPVTPRSNVGDQCLARGHFDTRAGKAGTEPAVVQSEDNRSTPVPLPPGPLLTGNTNSALKHVFDRRVSHVTWRLNSRDGRRSPMKLCRKIKQPFGALKPHEEQCKQTR